MMSLVHVNVILFVHLIFLLTNNKLVNIERTQQTIDGFVGNKIAVEMWAEIYLSASMIKLSCARVRARFQLKPFKSFCQFCSFKVFIWEFKWIYSYPQDEILERMQSACVLVHQHTQWTQFRSRSVKNINPLAQIREAFIQHAHPFR